jgi:type IV pilus assembly protein PilB
MNDNVSLAVGGPRSGLGGLPQRLVQDGVVEEAAMLEAMNVARERNTSIVTQLVSSGAAQECRCAISTP